MEPEESAALSDAAKEIQSAIDAIISAQSPQQQQDLNDDRQPLPGVGKLADGQPFANQIDPEEEREFRRKSLQIQKLLFYATFAAFGAAAWYAHVAGQQKDTMDDTLNAVNVQTHATQRSAEAAKESADPAVSQTRPWMRIVDVALDTSRTNQSILSFMPMPTVKPMNGVVLRVEFTIKNIGAGVAQNVYISPGISFERWDETEDKIAKEEDRSCKYWEKIRMERPFDFSALFPEDQIKQKMAVSVPFGNEAINHLPFRPNGAYLTGALIACVTYQHPRGYQTRAVFHLMGEHDRLLEIGKNLSAASDIHLLRDSHYEYAQ